MNECYNLFKMFRVLNRKILLGTTLRLTPAAFLPFFEQRNENDYNLVDKAATEIPKTGWERVKQMFTVDEHEFSLELTGVVQTSMCGVFGGVCYGGFVKSRQAYLYFIENNQASIFKSTFEAKRKLQDYVTIAFAKGAYRWGWRLGFFMGLYSLITTTISVYRDKNSVIEFVVAGAITGALYKANLGLAASIVGAGLGSALSFIGGLAIVGLLKISHTSMHDIRQSFLKISEIREKYYNKGWEVTAKERNDAVTKHHDELVNEKGNQKIDELA